MSREQVYDDLVLGMCRAFVNKDCAEQHCEIEEVYQCGHHVEIYFNFPCSMGRKSSMWNPSMLELMAFVWSQQP